MPGKSQHNRCGEPFLKVVYEMPTRVDVTNKRTIILCLAAATMILASCGSAAETSSSPSALPYTEQPVRPSTTLIDHEPIVEMTEGQDALTTFEAALICDRGSQSYESAGAIDESRDQLLAEYGLTLDEYMAFRGELEASRDLRDVVIFKYQETCS